ncbi:MAG TPA: hypothetical protein VHJ18_27515 [Streptosporangiaceae bacterium]|jgi:hypothetical protein|nr:hypothetical protein [Streptosporangiaceae bacterium]
MTFGLERTQSLEGHETRKLRSAAFAARLIFEPAVREGSAAGRARARAGELARDAAAAARGRPIPEQRRRKNARASGAGLSAAAKTASRERADRKLAAVASSAAARQGFADIGTLVAAKMAASLAAVSREIGLQKDWLSRHLVRLDPMAASLARQRPRSQPDGAWKPILDGLGFDDVGAYLRDRHVLRHQTVNAIAAEMGMSRHAVDAALRRHGLTSMPHAAKRHAASQRAALVAARLGYPSVPSYVNDRRAAGWTWNSIASESGQPQSWLRRHAAQRPDSPRT